MSPQNGPTGRSKGRNALARRFCTVCIEARLLCPRDIFRCAAKVPDYVGKEDSPFLHHIRRCKVLIWGKVRIWEITLLECWNAKKASDKMMTIYEY